MIDSMCHVGHLRVLSPSSVRAAMAGATREPTMLDALQKHQIFVKSQMQLIVNCASILHTACRPHPELFILKN